MSDRHDLLKMEAMAVKLAAAARGVNDNIMSNGLAYRREVLEQRIMEAEAMVDENRIKRAGLRVGL